MKTNVENLLNDYSMLTYYDEIRDETGRLLFCNGHSFDGVKIDEDTRYITLTNKNDSSSICMLDPNLGYKIIPLKYAIDKLIFQSGNNAITFFCKKK